MKPPEKKLSPVEGFRFRGMLQPSSQSDVLVVRPNRSYNWSVSDLSDLLDFC